MFVSYQTAARSGCKSDNKRGNVMKIMNGLAVAGFIFGALILSSTESLGQDDDCDHGGNHVIRVSVGEGGAPVLKYREGSAENVEVCKGDSVRWVLNGPVRGYFVNFSFPEGAPFADPKKRRSHENTVAVMIDDSAEGPYDYGVNFADGEGMDPTIIVN